ncbi:MFS transporter [Cellulomonas hominis]|uniref:MFS transporter n=1 Tax=Cellulomonas hominis TaxID=156981 RepID=UPI001BCF4570|nr:MFS transporter [Cellulomonas hominis]
MSESTPEVTATKMTVTRADKRSRWALSSLMVAVFAVGTAEYVIAGILPTMATELDVSVPRAGQLVTAYALSVVVGGPILTAATAKLNRFSVMRVLLVLFLAGNVAAAVAPGFGVLVVARVVSALTHSTLFAIALVMASSLAPRGRESSAIARVALGLNLATVLGVPIGTQIGLAAGWRATFVFVAAATVLALVLVSATVRLEPQKRAGGSAFGEFRVLRNTNVLLAMFMTVLGQTGLFTFYTYVTPYLTDVSGVRAESVVGILLLFGFGGAVGNVIGGRLADRNLLGSLTVLLVLGAAVLLSLGAFGSVPWLAVVLVFLLGVTGFSVIPALQTRIISSAGDSPTLALALNISAFQIANALGSVIGGATVGGPAGVSSTPFVGALPTALAVVVALVVLRGARRRRPSGKVESHEAAADVRGVVP